MIEYYTLMHKGGQEEYRDNIFLNINSPLTMLILYSSKNEKFELADSMSIGSLITDNGNIPMSELLVQFHEILPLNTEYLLMKIDDKHIEIERRGKVYAKIIKRGEVLQLSNGYFSLENGDQICCGTAEFFKHITDVAVISDAMTSISSEEWMDSLCCRVSDATFFEGGNLSAVTMIVRED